MLIISFSASFSGTCRQLEFDDTFDERRLENHVICTVDVTGERSCRTLCYMEPNCVSYNFNRATRKCELNNSTLREENEKMETNPHYIYCGAKVHSIQYTENKEIRISNSSHSNSYLVIGKSLHSSQPRKYSKECLFSCLVPECLCK